MQNYLTKRIIYVVLLANLILTIDFKYKKV